MNPVDNQTNAQSNPPGDARLIRVLVIDDDEADRKRYLKWLGEHCVDVVDSLALAAQQATEHQYDVVLCDVTMPEIQDLRPIDIIHFCKHIQGARLVAVNEQIRCCDAKTAKHELCSVINSCRNSKPRSLVIELINDVQAIRRSIRGPAVSQGTSESPPKRSPRCQRE